MNNMVRDSIEPDVTMFVHYETLTVDCKGIAAVTIQQGTDRPYYLGSKGQKPSGVYVRNGTYLVVKTKYRQFFLSHSRTEATLYQ